MTAQQLLADIHALESEIFGFERTQPEKGSLAGLIHVSA